MMGSMVQVKYTGLIFAVVWGLFLAVVLLRKCGWRVALRWSAAAGALAGGDRLALVRLCLSGHGKSLLSFLGPLVPVALLG